jgi:hypothetical protein
MACSCRIALWAMNDTLDRRRPLALTSISHTSFPRAPCIPQRRISSAGTRRCLPMCYFPNRFAIRSFARDSATGGYGWFITKIPPGQPGAGSTLAEMRGDMPGNFFCSINRFPDQDAVIIVLRNGYGSSERLEANLQALLFDQHPRVRWRKPADVLVLTLRSVTRWVDSHSILTVLLAATSLLLFVRWRRPLPKPPSL